MNPPESKPDRAANRLTQDASDEDRVKRRFEDLFEAVPDATVVVDGEGKIVLANSHTERLFGYDREELHDQRLEILLPERLWDRHVGHRKSFFGDPSTRAMGTGLELCGRRKDGQEFPVDISLSPLQVEEMSFVVGSIRDITEQKQAERKLQQALEEIAKLKDRLQAENVYLREEIKSQNSHSEIIGQSAAIEQVLGLVEQVALTDSAVLLLGETGTGKELLARAIHRLSPREGQPMVTVNCAALPSTLVESELFGSEEGAYTGALSKRIGRFEIADGSTIFLDEIGDLPADVQVKLLRVLQEGQFERLGSSRTITVNVRIVAATNRDLSAAVEAGCFREDLYYRLNVFPISVPPLRERGEDIAALVWAFVEELGMKMGKSIESIPRRTMQELQAYPWPGNVRELRNVIERAMILSKGSNLQVEVPRISDSKTRPNLTLDEFEREYILEVLDKTQWRVSGKNGAAEILGLKPTTLESRMAKLGINREP